jgi:hypothetical protein
LINILEENSFLVFLNKNLPLIRHFKILFILYFRKKEQLVFLVK